MAYVGLEAFLSRLEPGQQQQVKSAAKDIELHLVKARHAQATKEKFGLAAVISVLVFVAVICDLIFHNGVIREIQQLLGGAGIAAATLAGPILGGLWLKAKLTADR